MYKTVLVMIICLTASACQTSYTEEQCLTADWQAVGHEDGLKGRSADYFTSYLDACAKHELVPLRKEYNLGRDQGLVLYCQPVNGFNQGREGIEYLAVCSAQQELEFLPAYEEGRLIGDKERELAALIDIRRSFETEIKSIDRRLDSRLFADLSRGERPISVELNQVSQSLQEQKHELEERIQQVTREIDDLTTLIELMLSNIRIPG